MTETMSFALPPDLSDPTNVGRRIKWARQHARGAPRGLTQDDLGELVSNIVEKEPAFGKQTVSRWENGTAEPSYSALRAIAEITGYSATWLWTGRGDPLATDIESRERVMPVLTPNAARNWIDGKEVNLADATTIVSTSPTSPAAFAIEITDDSMAPEIGEGDIIIFDPEMEPYPGEIVAVAIDRQPSILIRRYKPRGVDATGSSLTELAPANSNWPPLFLSPQSTGRIVGTLAEYRRFRRRRRSTTRMPF